jgi:hypothetical protein
MPTGGAVVTICSVTSTRLVATAASASPALRSFDFHHVSVRELTPAFAA